MSEELQIRNSAVDFLVFTCDVGGIWNRGQSVE